LKKISRRKDEQKEDSILSMDTIFYYIPNINSSNTDVYDGQDRQRIKNDERRKTLNMIFIKHTLDKLNKN
jgi:hypothetical protein